jgi:hypothetical protein
MRSIIFGYLLWVTDWGYFFLEILIGSHLLGSAVIYRFHNMNAVWESKYDYEKQVFERHLVTRLCRVARIHSAVGLLEGICNC